MTGTGETITSEVTDDNLRSSKKNSKRKSRRSKDLEKLSKQIEITITPEGLRIELIEDKNGTFYELRQRPAQRERPGIARAAGKPN